MPRTIKSLGFPVPPLQVDGADRSRDDDPWIGDFIEKAKAEQAQNP
jgi:hypothetical protein